MAVDYLFVMANPRKKRQENANGVFSPLSPGQVALIEEHPDHPLDPTLGIHRIFIVQGDPPCEAAPTEAVQEKILQRQLVQLSRADALKKYKEMTGKNYPGVAEEPVVDEDDEDENLDADAEKAAVDAAKKAAANEKRKATLAAKKAAQEVDQTESDESDEDDGDSDEE